MTNYRIVKNRCPHNVIEPQTIDPHLIRYHCKSCGESMGESIDVDEPRSRSNIIPELSEQDRQAWR